MYPRVWRQAVLIGREIKAMDIEGRPLKCKGMHAGRVDARRVWRNIFFLFFLTSSSYSPCSFLFLSNLVLSLLLGGLGGRIWSGLEYKSECQFLLFFHKPL
jgi:hypothetical protein